MCKVPIPSLYNIFYNKNRVLKDHEKAYQFIVSNNNPNFFILIKSLDSTKLSESILKESISNQDEHFGFIPNNSFYTLKEEAETLKKENDQLKKQVSEHEMTISKLKQQIPLCITKVGYDYRSWYEADILFIVDGRNEKLLTKPIDAVNDIMYDIKLNLRRMTSQKLFNFGVIYDLENTSKIIPFSKDLNIEKIYVDFGIIIDEIENNDDDDDDDESFNIARNIVTHTNYANLIKCAINDFDWKENSSKTIFFISSSGDLDNNELLKCVIELAKNNYNLLCYYFNDNAKSEFTKMEKTYKVISYSSFFTFDDISYIECSNKLVERLSMTFSRPFKFINDDFSDL